MYRRKDKGLTLIELMVVITIAAILAAMAVPAFNKLIERQQLRQAAESLKSDKQLVRVAAIKRSADIIFMRNTGATGTWCYGAGVSTVACDCTQATTTASDYCSIIRTMGTAFPKTDVTSILPVTAASTVFESRRGTIVNSPFETCFRTTNYALKVEVNDGGKVEICSDVDAPVGGYDGCSTNTCTP